MSDRSAVLAVFFWALLAPATAFASIRLAEVVMDNSAGGDLSPKAVEVPCPAGTDLLGGGARASQPLNLRQVSSRALLDAGSGDAIGWSAEYAEIHSNLSDWWVTAVALCGRAQGLERVEATSGIGSGTTFLDVSCPPGKSALGGGFDLAGATNGVAIRASVPILDETSGAPIGWTVAAYEEILGINLWSLRAEVLCADEPVLAFQVIEPYSSEQLSGLDLHCPAGWIATGGGVQVVGLLADWITWNTPSPVETGAWVQRLARATGVTGNAEHDYFVVCPEPGDVLSAASALAIVLSRARTRARDTRR